MMGGSQTYGGHNHQHSKPLHSEPYKNRSFISQIVSSANINYNFYNLSEVLAVI